MLGVDNTAGITDVAGMRADGYSAIFRYLSNTPGKNLIMATPPFDAELRRYLDGGVAVVLNWESSGHVSDQQTNHPGDPHGQGIEDATRAQDQATRMGHPEAPIYFSIDFDDSDWGALAAYFQAVNSVIGVARTGVYGGYWVVDYLLQHGLVTYVWQTLAWSTVNGCGHTRHPRANVIQRVGEVRVRGVACDVDEIVTPVDFGQLPRPTGAACWPPAPPPPAPGGAPAYTSWPDVRDGDTSALIWHLQTFMDRVFPAYSRIDAGPGPISRCGPATEAAVTTFQGKVGIPTGAPFGIGQRTWAALWAQGFRG